eukprot:COSAG03_NODE_226_length_10318_cov_14.007925_3_plen_56_part_00
MVEIGVEIAGDQMKDFPIDQLPASATLGTSNRSGKPHCLWTVRLRLRLQIWINSI